MGALLALAAYGLAVTYVWGGVARLWNSGDAVERATSRLAWGPLVGSAIGLRVFGMLEIGVGLFVALRPLDSPVIAAALVLSVGAVFTAGGALALRRIGSCGCGGSRSFAADSLPALIKRNLTLFGSTVAVVLLAPDLSERAAAIAAALSGVAPMVVLISLLVIRQTRARRFQAVREGRYRVSSGSSRETLTVRLEAVD